MDNESWQMHLERLELLNQQDAEQPKQRHVSEFMEETYLKHHFELLEDENGKDVRDKGIVIRVCWIGQSIVGGEKNLGFARDGDTSLTFVNFEYFVLNMVGRARPDVDKDTRGYTFQQRRDHDGGLPF